MKSIRQKIFVLIVLPILTIFIIFSVFIVFTVYRTRIEEAEQQLYRVTLYNAINLKNCYDVAELSVQICATELEMIDPLDPMAREKGEHIITSRFNNPQVISAWLVFEPNAFDFKDDLITEDNPGVTKGRYIRSFVREGSSYRRDEKQAEYVINNPEESYWYFIPMRTGTIFTDFGSREMLWDYGSGPISCFVISAPVFKGGRVIGCVGLDVKINEETLGDSVHPNVVSRIFLPEGIMGYSLETDKVGKTLDELNFSDSGRIKQRMENLQSIYLNNDYSEISSVKSLVYFYPALISDKFIYIYASLPRQDIWDNIIPVLMPIGISLFICLLILCLLLLYLSEGIGVPLKKLSQTSEAVVMGNLDAHINIVRSNDEMGMISRSLARMAEQFRSIKLLQERYHNRVDILLRIHYALFRSNSLKEAFDVVLVTISEYVGAFMSSMVFMVKDTPMIVAQYFADARNSADSVDEGDSEFFAHSQMVKLLERRNILIMNSGALKAAQISFVNYGTAALCVLPLRIEDVLRGYIIMEGKEPLALVHDDKTLLFLGDTLSYLLSCRSDWEQEITENTKSGGKRTSAVSQNTNQEAFIAENVDAFLEKAKNIQNLNVDKGILLIGGEKKQYTELLRVTIKVISVDILKMRHSHTENLSAFAIEVHGIKAALYSIGAEALGDEARQLEFAAKSDDAVYCRENYPFLEEKLRILSRNLMALFPKQERNFQKGNVEELAEILDKAREACDVFDISAVNALLGPLSVLKWDNEAIQNSLRGILLDMENLEYSDMADKISLLRDMLGDKKA